MNFIIAEAKQIDGLVLYGPYPLYFPIAPVYKQLNPKGKIYLALDANTGWMDRIQWAEPAFRNMMDSCDVIAASGRVLQRHLNEKWPWKIEHLPNGFFNYTGMDCDASFQRKKDVILSVARHGTAQKRTDVLLTAFARIANLIPGWELHLAGSVDPQFEDSLSEYWELFPHLRTRIRFLGNIADRNELYREYLSAKIFALPSDWEGGTPNVVAEALTAGDVMAVAKFDEYAEAIGDGRCGLAAEKGDYEQYADVLLKLCRSGGLRTMSENARAWAKENFDMERIVARLYCMMFGGEA